jgi:hypothetical protein
VARPRPLRAGLKSDRAAGAAVPGAKRPRLGGQGGKQQSDREFVPLFGQIGNVVPGHDHLEDPAVDFPVTKLRGPPLIHTQVDDVQPVAEIVEHEARLTVVRADGARFPQRVEVI